jgi:dextranase
LKGAQGEELVRAEVATRLASAAIWASGGFHLLMGETNAALCDPYYPAYASLRSDFAETMRSYYDFVVRYENLLSDLRMVTMSSEAIQGSIQIDGLEVSARGEAGTAWSIIRQLPEFTTVSLINLTAATEANWNEPKSVPQSKRDLSIRVRVDGQVTGVFSASPEFEEGRPCQLAYSLIESEGETWLQTTLPVLEYWSMITIKTATNDPV